MSAFHNPYHFVPLPAAPTGPGRHPLGKDPFELPPQATHDRYVADTFSGQITCRLTTITPLVIGGVQTGNPPKCVNPFTAPGQPDRPLIPGSALRGLISSIAEAASDSAFRVLTDRIFSYRRSMAEGLSALGLIVESNGELRLHPLVEPHMESVDSTNFDLRDALPKDQADYSAMFAVPLWKVYFGNAQTIRVPQFLDRYHTNSAPHGGPFYALAKTAVSRKIKTRHRARQLDLHFALGYETDAEPEPWDDQKHNETTHIRGILRVLGVSSETRKTGMPTRKHEFFIPFSRQREDELRSGKAPTFPILPEALERFQQLADERTQEADEDTLSEDLLPFTPHGQTRSAKGVPKDPQRPERAYYLKPGDVVFFRPTEDGRAVAEISLSSIWRGRVEQGREGAKRAARVSDFIASADPALLPLGDLRKTHLTPAELLFGFVEHEGQRALAGRVRFLDAAPCEGQKDLLHPEWVDLQILNSPKPPSPNFYFRKRAGAGWIRKSALNLKDHQIQGRKFYLHTQNPAAATRPDDPRWTMHRENVDSRRYDKMRVRVRPILAGEAFEFRVRFDNLNRFELGMLLHALHPSDGFHHKLGLGKPLGLGTVKIEWVNLEVVDRTARYITTALTAPRAATAKDPQPFVDDYLAALRAADPKLASLNALLALGNPDKVRHPVHYPQVAGSNPGDAAFEQDRYAWFMQNDDTTNHRQPGQYLQPIVDATGCVAQSLPALYREQSGHPPAVNYSPSVQAARNNPAPAPSRTPPPRPQPSDEHEFTAAKHEKDGRVLFTMSLGGTGWRGYLDVPKAQRDQWRARFPVGSKVTLKIKGVSSNLLQLHPPPQ